MHDAGVKQRALFSHTVDSLSRRQSQIQVAADSALARLARDTVREHQSAARIAQESARATQQAAQQMAQASMLRARLADSVRASFDSLQAAQAQIVASLMSQRDSALALFRGAATTRDSLAVLLRESQGLIQGYQGALKQAMHRSLWDHAPIRVGLLVGAYILGRKT